jgi:hypothetical protein
VDQRKENMIGQNETEKSPVTIGMTNRGFGFEIDHESDPGSHTGLIGKPIGPDVSAGGLGGAFGFEIDQCQAGKDQDVSDGTDKPVVNIPIFESHYHRTSGVVMVRIPQSGESPPWPL